MTEKLVNYSEKIGDVEKSKPNKIVEVGPNVDFVYIMRKDGDFAMSPVASEIAGEYQLNEDQIKGLLLEEYDTFFSKLADLLLTVNSGKGNVELHLYDPEVLDKAERKKAGVLPIVSLDPLMCKGVYGLRVSRGYYQGGKIDHGQINSPGYCSLASQAQHLAKELSGVPVCVVEDDVFSGGSVISALENLLKAGIKIQKLIPGIQVGKPTKLEAMGISVDSVIEYKTSDGSNIFDKVDLGDPRDFLLGASGLVVKIPSCAYGRVPYILPFVSTAARASIPKQKEKEFALKILQANIEFFSSCEGKIGKPVLLKHMNSAFIKAMSEQYNFGGETPMVQVITWAMNNLDFIWELNSDLGLMQEKLDALKMTENLVFIDINGTLIPDGSNDGSLDQACLEQFKKAVEKLTAQGVAIGLCSDSPLPQVAGFADKIGVNGPIIAENGNIVANNGVKIVMNTLENLAELKAEIIEHAGGNGFSQIKDSVAVEFGGCAVNFNSGYWAFGAGRETSISVFGPSSLVEKLGEVFGKKEGASVDCSPEYNYFAIHPGKYWINKGKTLAMLKQFGHRVVMVGNSKSDWVDASMGVKCAFVGQARVSTEIKQKAYLVSNKPTIEGVTEILSKLL